jgi:EAL domain-containing protein (putative c-di-GMP-specific phosphodiesterase class I)
VAAFQPIVDLRSGETVGEEALARIVTAERALVPAEQFVGAAEALHLIKAIDHAVSRQALARAARGNAKGRARFINLSGQFLADGAQVEALVREAEALNMLPAANGHEFVVELTERRTAELGSLRKQLAPLLEAGFALALDDFGSGSSSFMYLTDLPVSYLKIEGWMVQRIASDARIRQLVRTIVDTAQAFQLKTVAECVEQEQSAHVLRDLGVDWGQGFFFAEPVVSPSA